MERFNNLANLNLARLRKHIDECLATRDSVLLSEVLEKFPLTDGAIEIIGYLAIAIQDGKGETRHYVSKDQFTIASYLEGAHRSVWRVPEILFGRTE